MDVFYTKTYNLSGPNAQKQDIAAQLARSLGYKEISLFRFEDSYDNDIELCVRMQAITTAVSRNSTVIFQYPSMVSLRYDRCLMDQLRKKNGLHLILWASDLGSEVYNEKYTNICEEISLFNMADMLILPSHNMKEHLEKAGLNPKLPVLYQEVWDYPYPVSSPAATIQKIPDYFGGTLKERTQLKRSCGISILGTKGNWYEYASIPMELTYCLAKGCPAVAASSSRAADFVHTYDVGLIYQVTNANTDVVATVSNILSTVSEDRWNIVCTNVLRIRELLLDGAFTKRLLTEAVLTVTTQGLPHHLPKMSNTNEPIT